LLKKKEVLQVWLKSVEVHSPNFLS
jgi:hypothetical protein